MTDDMMNLPTLAEKTPDADPLREMIGFAAQRLMGLEVGRPGRPARRAQSFWPSATARSCPLAWCNWRRVTAFTGRSRAGQLAIAGRLTVGSSLNGAIVSSVM